jgi:hypothetical protein
MSSIDFNTIDNLIIDGDANEYHLRGPLTPEQKTRTLNYLEEGFDKMLEQNPNSKDYITIATFTDGTQINEFYLPRQHFIDLEKARPVTPPVAQRLITSNILNKFNASRRNLAATKKAVANAAARQQARQQAGINAAKAKAAAAKAQTNPSTTFKPKPMPKFGGKRTRRLRKQTRRS